MFAWTVSVKTFNSPRKEKKCFFLIQNNTVHISLFNIKMKTITRNVM